jgi:26S proteasome regulatory subunit N1
VEGEEPTEDLFHLAAEIIPYFMAHNAEADACNLLMEVRLCCTCRSC